MFLLGTVPPCDQVMNGSGRMVPVDQVGVWDVIVWFEVRRPVETVWFSAFSSVFRGGGGGVQAS
jgi:hypothetical protein